MKSRIILFAALATFFVPLQAQVQDTNSTPTLVFVTSGKKQVRLEKLQHIAREYIFAKAPEARTNKGLNASAFVDCSGQLKAVHFMFYGKPGEKVYNVWCDLDGKVTKYEMHIGDIVDHKGERR
jgi:hypothetical protein